MDDFKKQITLGHADFNPNTSLNNCADLSSCCRKCKMHKENYKQHIREVKHATFMPIVIAATGGLARQGNVCFLQKSSLLSCKEVG